MLKTMIQAIARFCGVRPGCTLVRVSPLKQLAARANQCFDNTMTLCLAKPQRYTLRSGWLVGPDLKHLGTVFIPHYWVFNEKTMRHLDPTPRAEGDRMSYQYLLDMDLLAHASAEHPLPPALRLNLVGDFEVFMQSGRWQALENLGTQLLFELARVVG
jgi:hypothetical protein